MDSPTPRLSRAVTAHATIVAGLSVAHSLRTRGLRGTLLFAALGHAVPVLGEHLAVNVLGLLRHRLRPQIRGIPLAIALGWYNVGYATLTMVENILQGTEPYESRPDRVLPPAAALTATSLDLLLDPLGLDLGLWEWRMDGPYAAGIRGANGKRGVPLLNYAGWIGATATVVLAYRRLDPRTPSSTPEAGRLAALLLLSYYLPAAAWALRRRKFRYLLYSAPSLAALLAALGGRPPSS